MFTLVYHRTSLILNVVLYHNVNARVVIKDPSKYKSITSLPLTKVCPWETVNILPNEDMNKAMPYIVTINIIIKVWMSALLQYIRK